MVTGVAGFQHARPDIEGWREIAWPFPRDGWPAGRAFRCGAASCGEEIALYLRPKIGFCNCDSVADDDEVDRVADLDLVSAQFVALEPGRVIRIAGMPGRSRSYQLSTSDGLHRTAVGFALSRRCDLFVAVAQGNGAGAGIQRATLEFLASGGMPRWMVPSMDGR